MVTENRRVIIGILVVGLSFLLPFRAGLGQTDESFELAFDQPWLVEAWKFYQKRDHSSCFKLFNAKLTSGKLTDKQKAEAFETRAKIHVLTGHYQKGADDYSSVIGLSGAKPEHFFGRGQCYCFLGKAKLCLKDMEHVIKNAKPTTLP